ncbi:MAG TPA: hypothetical protein VNZ45_02295 [Bacteroidia bacterium]|jgi:hypothetical protein|nr:hypothetical protein [Bacteroidia bacterium]
MASTIIIILLLFGVLSYTYIAPRAKARKRIKQFKKARQELFGSNPDKGMEDPRRTGLNIPGYYEDIVNKDKLKKIYKWELHDSF